MRRNKIAMILSLFAKKGIKITMIQKSTRTIIVFQGRGKFAPRLPKMSVLKVSSIS